jgi:hypothetical protein
MKKKIKKNAELIKRQEIKFLPVCKVGYKYMAKFQQ